MLLSFTDMFLKMNFKNKYNDNFFQNNLKVNDLYNPQQQLFIAVYIKKMNV